MKISFRKFPYRSLSLKLKEEKGVRRRLGLLEGSISALTGERRLPPHVERGVRGPQAWCGPRGPACWGRLAARANYVTEMEPFPGSEGGQNGTRDQWRVRPRLRVAPSC